MIKCPSCGVKVQGNDLLTGVCSNCHHRLSVGDSATGSDDMGATLATDVSVPRPGGPLVDSVSGGVSGFQFNSAGSKDSSGSASGADAGVDQTMQSDELLGSSSDSGTPGSGSVEPPSATLSHEAQRPDTSYDSGHIADDQNDSQATYVSDEFGDGTSGTAGGVGGADDGLGSATLDSATLSGENDSDKTFVADVDDESADAEAGLRTMIDAPSAVSASGDSDKTYVYDADSDAGGDDAGMRTLIEDPAAIASDADSDKTFVSDEFVSGDDPEAGARTLISDTFKAEAADGGTDKTFIADEMPEALLKTVESVWGEPSAVDNAAPSMTLKAKEPKASKSPRQTLVIKTKSFSEMKSGVSVSRDGDEPEYELLKVLGEGGMGIVYDARQTSIDRNVAVKMLKAATAGNEKQRAKFLAEAVVTGDLDHPNIVPIYDVGANGEGALFYSMKKVQGTPWMKVIQKKSVAENLDILMRIADAIGFAHARGIVHRDLKPENVMLGEFGEVLVMDWGLAQASRHFRKSRSITETNTMGGTPAYMAPEMATGPIEKISPASDVYLLGAMLYEIVTGGPPHVAKTAMKCLMAAARNEIAPTDKSGELVDIALHAMKTDPKDRYQDVKSFQAAIRDYQSHSESIVLSTRAEEDLKEAQQDDDYQHYSRALFGFQEAHELWSGNKRAMAGISEAQLAYADSARRKGDFDLGLSLLVAANPDHTELRRLLIEAQQDVAARHKRFVFLKRMAGGLAASVFLIVCTASALIYRAQQEAVTQRDIARDKEREAVIAQGKEADAKADALKQRDIAKAKETEAIIAQGKEADAKADALKQRDIAVEKEQEAVIAQRKEAEAKANAEYEAYISQIGLAASQIDKNAFDAARDVLNRCKPELRNWEWGRLRYLCYQSEEDFPGQSPLDALAIRRDGERFAVGGWNATARIVDRKTHKVIHTLPHGGEYVHAIAFSPDGKFVATGSNDAAGFVQLWDAETGKRIRVFPGHEDAVLSVAFSNDGASLLSSSYDKTARLWDVASGSERVAFKGHTWWVWSAAFSADDRKVVTASQDGTARVWEAATGKPLQIESTETGGEKKLKDVPPFRGHHGPVYTAAFSPNDSDEVVTGGYDRRILIWKPSDIEPENFGNLAREGGTVVPPAKFVAMEGHTDAVRSLAFSTGSQGVLLVSAGQDHTVRVWDYARRQPIKAFRGHGGSVQAAAFASDGRSILSASHDKSVRQWSIDNYEEIRTLRGRVLSGHQDAVLSAAYSNDQTQVVTASRDRTARTWETGTGKPELTFEEGHAYLASSAMFFPDGRRLVTAAVDNTARVWDVSTGGQLFRLDHSGRSAAVALSHDGRWIATGGDDKSAQLWNAQSGKRLQKLDGHIAEVTAVAFSPDHQLLATGDAKGQSKLWNIAEGRVVFELKGHTRKISAIVFLPDGSRVLTASLDKTVSQWDVTSGRELPKLSLRHPDGVLSMKLVPGREPRVVTSCSILKRGGKASGTTNNDQDRDQTECQLRVWNVGEPKVELALGPLDGDVYSLDVSTDGNRLIAANSRDRTVRQWDLSSGREVQLPKRNGDLGPIIDLKSQGLLWSTAFLPDSDDILTVGGSDARLWNIRTNPVSERMSFSPHRAVASARFSPDGNWIVTGSWDNSAKIWDAHTGKDIRKLEGIHKPEGLDDAEIAHDPTSGHTSLVNSAVFSPDGKFVLTASDDGTAKLWNVETGKVTQTLAGHTDRVRSAAFSPKGDFIVTTSSDKTARLWNGHTGAFVREFKGHDWAVLCANFSRDGQRLVTGSEDNEAWIWDVATAHVLHKLTGHTAGVTSVAFSPDSTRVLTGSQDQSAKLWDAAKGKEILTLSRHTEDVTSVTFSPDGSQVLTASRDGTAVIWLARNWVGKEELSAAKSTSGDEPVR